MSRVIELKFPLLNGGRAGGINDADLETFSKDPNYYIARECAQNTLDAVDKTIGTAKLHFALKEIPASELPCLLALADVFRSCREFRPNDTKVRQYPIVAETNPSMGSIIFQDFKRRSQKPQTPAMIRSITKTASTITEGGIHLPAGKIVLSLDEIRLQSIAIKIARGVLCLNGIAYLSESSCFDIRMPQNESEVIELYRLSWAATPKPQGNYHQVFSYRYFCCDNRCYVTLLFWGSVMYCLGFEM